MKSYNIDFLFGAPRKSSALISPKEIIVHSALFIFTFISCLMAGAQWVGKDYTEITNWTYGFAYASLISFFLLSHEFGHYFASRIHKVNATLPYCIPVPFPSLFPFGTMGAVIKTRTPIPNRKALFDIGAAGPIAGFIVSCFCLIWGFTHLPDKSYIYNLHPEYILQFGGEIPTYGLRFGDTLLFEAAKLFAPAGAFIPPMNEIYHYPFLCVGWFGLFVTCLNLLPIGQLDGGHIIYAMFGEKQKVISRIFWYCLIALGLGSFIGLFFQYALLPDSDNLFILKICSFFRPFLSWINDNAPWYYFSWGGWIFWAAITRIFIKLDHPYVEETSKLGLIRQIIGWATIIIFVLSFSFNGIYEL